MRVVASLYMPETADPLEARAALDKDLAQVLHVRGVASLEELGWRRPKPLVLLIPLKGAQGDTTDSFLAELSFAYYPEWPPKVRFVNPETLDFKNPVDLCWVPRIEGYSAIATHKEYSGGGLTFHGYVCCSFNLDFYLSDHNLSNPHEHWKASPRTFNATVSMLERGLRLHYQGRMQSVS